MRFPFPHILLSGTTTHAICWTLIHSLWQGILTAALAGLIIAGTRRWRAVIRYNLLVADLLLFLLITVATFLHEIRIGDRLVTPRVAVEFRRVTGGAVKAATKAATVVIRKTSNTYGGVMVQDLIGRAGQFLNAHANVVVLIWLACLLGQLLRLTGGLYQLQRLRRDNVFPPGDHWTEKLSELADRFGVNRKVNLLQSGLVRTPVAFGFLKPCILIPLGMLANLPPDQAEAILLHELAHIRRNDYISNLLLHIAEAIFFFNPGVRWVASRVRQEREACCDDMVLAGVPDKNSDFEALVAFKQWIIDRRYTGVGSYMLQLGGGKGDLLWRIRRMLDQENKKLQLMEKTILSFGLMAVVSISLIGMKARDWPAARVGSVHRVMRPVVQTKPVAPVRPAKPVRPVKPEEAMKDIIADLLDNGLITAVDPLSFTLNNQGLILNGVKREAAIYSKFKAKYIITPRDHFSYDHHGGFTHSEISVK
jgi:bla regulator protein blaR1